MERRRRGGRVALRVLVAVPQVLLGAHLAAAGSPAGPAYALLGAATVAVALLLRRFPGPAAVAIAGLGIAGLGIVQLPPLALLPVALAVLVAAASGARWWAVGAAAAVVTLPLAQLFVVDRPSAGRTLGSTLLVVVALGAGAFIRTRRQFRRDERARAADRQRIAVEQERVRIARELHDVLAHSLSSISVQAGVGLHLAPDRPQAALDALEAIRDASRSALDEVRGVLGVLRGDERAPLAPELGLAALPALVEDLRRSGARVLLDDRLRPLPTTAVQLALYRIVQESLTNARRHAPGAEVRVGLSEEAGTAIASIRSVLPGSAPQVAEGNGITGMRERAAQLGGALDVVRHADGVEVVARIPLTAWETR